jgi:hypothetical protein
MPSYFKIHSGETELFSGNDHQCTFTKNQIMTLNYKCNIDLWAMDLILVFWYSEYITDKI